MPEKKSILFVDDEREILDGLQLRLRRQRRVWDMTFAHGSDTGIELLENRRFDVVVTDVQMPGRSGVAVLDTARKHSPSTARIALSGQVDDLKLLKLTPLAHRFISKPCPADKLRETLEAVIGLTERIGNPRILELIGAVDSLPTRPSIHQKLVAAVQRIDGDAAVLAEIVRQDMGLATKVLQIANSAYFGSQVPVVRLESAVAHIGVESLAYLSLTLGMFRAFEPSAKLPDLSADDLFRHSLLCAGIAREIVGSDVDPENVVNAALVHDCGKLLLACRAEDAYREVLAQAGDRPLEQVEREVLGVDHADVGGFLLHLWGLPAEVVETVAAHHTPPESCLLSEPQCAIYVANRLAHHVVEQTPDRDLEEFFANLDLEADREDLTEIAVRCAASSETAS
ncbi:hypothetical protein ABI59_18285 [Acidobacteria bacterium Mor1]|nr:hypothetical protein ABI59_18285 [Acidobacteria bacterium Mor1]